MIGSFRAEWLKLRKRPAVLAMAGLLLAAVVLVAYVLPYLGYVNAKAGFRTDRGLSAAQQLMGLYPAALVPHDLAGLYPFASALALVFGALIVGGEYGWGTMKTVLIQLPGRLETLAGRAAAVVVATGVMTVAFWVVGAIASLGIALLQSHAVTWPPALSVIEGAGTTWLVLCLWSVAGMALAFLLRSAPAAIGIGVAYLLAIEGLVFRLIVPLGGDLLRNVEKVFPGANVGALVGAFGPDVPANTPAPLVGAGQALAVLVLYLAVFGALAALMLRRRDVTG
jgi:ABC-2 type transport system permease protein